MMPQPRSRSILMMRNRCSTSSSVSEEVGSSNTMTSEWYETALAISTIWRWATGIVLTKLDGTAKGGAVISIKAKLGLPVRFVGVGEGMDDLMEFDPDAFVDALFLREE